MTIHKEGYLTLLIAGTAAALLSLTAGFLFTENEPMETTAYVFSILFFLLMLQFFRSPSRNVSANDMDILSPADGKIVVIEEVEENEFFHDRRMQVSIFMSPLNVHINWNPVSGIIKYFKYHSGNYIVAFHPKASHENERTTAVIETKEGRQVLIRQIAGMLARRIVFYVREGDKVIQGKELGFIKFGSRVDLLLPKDIKLNVKLNQKVVGTQTVIATFD